MYFLASQNSAEYFPLPLPFSLYSFQILNITQNVSLLFPMDAAHFSSVGALKQKSAEDHTGNKIMVY